MITYRGRDTIVNCRVYPMKKMPHVSVDSPRWQKAYPAQMGCVFTMTYDEQGYERVPKEHDLAYIEDMVLREWSYHQVATRFIARERVTA